MLGVTQTWSRQEEVLCSVAKHPRTAVRSGHKVSKSHTGGILATWWVSTRPRGKVILTSSSFENVETILWPEVRKLHRESRKPLGGYLLKTARGGWKFDDGRVVFGVSTDEPERAAGKSGDEILYIADEASGIEDEIFEAIIGNLAGGGRIIILGNPTQPTGQFQRAFTDEADVWNTIHISSEESPNVVARRVVIPGLCTYEWIQERERVWGRKSPLFQIRVEGNFADRAANVVIGLKSVEEARKRWESTKASGVLELGIDVARFGDDSSVIYPRRGNKAFDPTEVQGMDTVQVAGAARRVLKAHRRTNEKARVKVDVIGVGAGVADTLRAASNDPDDELFGIVVIDINVAEAAVASDDVDGSDDAEKFPNLRSQLWFGMGQWLSEGGAIPPSDKLVVGELTSPRYNFDARGRRQVEPKQDIKKRLKRSPDHAEALMLSIAPGDVDDGGLITFDRQW